MLAAIAGRVGPEDSPDGYGHGKLIEEFEREVAGLLGKETAVFMPSGTMCQQIALRIHTERRACSTVAFHPTCHLEIYEEDAYRRLHHLNGVLVGQRDRLMTLADLQRVRERLGAVLLELPQREIGGQLPSWEELTAITEWARERDIALHLDGARLWECQPYYGRSYAEICALFDTVYVSFYKILGGIAGAILAGPAEIIQEARVWQRRHGGNLVHLYPYVLAAKLGMEERLDRIPLYCERARSVADVLRTLTGVQVTPDPPQTNMMHIWFQGDAVRLVEAAMQLADETHILLFPPFALSPAAIPGWQRWELTIGDGALDISEEEIRYLFTQLMARAAPG
jgi:threonine aldolase